MSPLAEGFFYRRADCRNIVDVDYACIISCATALCSSAAVAIDIHRLISETVRIIAAIHHRLLCMLKVRWPWCDCYPHFTPIL